MRRSEIEHVSSADPYEAGAAARRLAHAWRSGEPIRDLGAARPRGRDEAYAIQDAVTELLGLPVVGWKVGAATPAIMRQRGLDEPIPGPLFGPRVYPSAATLPAADFCAANLETEFAFRTLAELPPRGRPYEPAALATYAGAWRRDPLEVLAWLVNSLGCRGIALPAGAVILTGSVTEPRPVAPGSSAVARFDGGAEVRLSIAAGSG